MKLLYNTKYTKHYKFIKYEGLKIFLNYTLNLKKKKKKKKNNIKFKKIKKVPILN